MRKTVTALLLGLTFSPLFGQKLTDASTRWSDSFAEWVLYETPDPPANGDEPQPEEVGRLKLRWPTRDNWTEWDLEMDGLRATIRQKWDNDPGNWELRANGELVTMKTRWPGDHSEWKVSGDRESFILKSRYSTPDEWLADGGEDGRFYMYTLYKGDPRDWAIEDDLPPGIGPELRLAMVFTVLFNSTPNK